MFIVLALTTGLLMGLAVSNIARGKGYGPTGLWFLYAFLVWPIALIHVAVLPNKNQRAADQVIEEMKQQPRKDFAGTIAGVGGAADQRGVLSLGWFDARLTTAGGDCWEDQLGHVNLHIRPDRVVEVTFGTRTWLFTPDDPALAATEIGTAYEQPQRS